mmetsp:Transcript_76614/g.135313  ORF Transcript_76614/g.135313 Transcript_76614/m.135313 type:complete len:81 (-) Transcript_76614:854-1096(-)
MQNRQLKLQALHSTGSLHGQNLSCQPFLDEGCIPQVQKTLLATNNRVSLPHWDPVWITKGVTPRYQHSAWLTPPHVVTSH